MRKGYVTFIVLCILLFLCNCPRRYAPGAKKIEVFYLGSLYEDMFREKPIMTGVNSLEGITLGHVHSGKPFLDVILQRLGFYQLLNETGIRYVCGDPETMRSDNMNYFLIPLTMGYVIENYEGIRFGIISKPLDSLSIEQEVNLTIARQRSDILWIIDKKFLALSPRKISFFIKDRGLADTSTTSFTFRSDTLLLRRIRDMRERLEAILDRSLHLDKKSVEDYVFTSLSDRQEANVILYSPTLLHETRKDMRADDMTLADFLTIVSCNNRFTRYLNVTAEKVESLITKHGYMRWGVVTAKNNVLLPDPEGEYVFDLLGFWE